MKFRNFLKAVLLVCGGTRFRIGFNALSQCTTPRLEVISMCIGNSKKHPNASWIKWVIVPNCV